MIPAIAATTALGTSAYVWLTVSMLPITRALRATLRSRRGDGWRYALPLAVGVSAIAGAAAIACAIAITMCAPRTGVLLGDPAVLGAGVLSGLLVWLTRAALLGPPRLSRDVEMALALAVVALKNDDATLLSTVEREYGGHVLDAGDRYVPQVVRTVLGV